MMKLLRAYRKTTENTGDCPSATTLNIEHHIDTGDAAPIMSKKRPLAQTDDPVVTSNVTKMLRAEVIE